MFHANALPPPPLFHHEHRPLRLTSELVRSQPQGACQYQHATEQSHRCACQIYQHNRSAPGNMCDCGHSACYHSPSRNEARLPPEKVFNALAEKVRRLEDVIVKEREQRQTLLCQERTAWENEVRMLREALGPVHRTEHNMQRKLADLEHRLETADEENARLKDKLFAIDEANNAIERHLEFCDASRCLKRKASLGIETHGMVSPGSNYTISSSASDTTSASFLRASQPPSPPMVSFGSPRSSGILNLKTNHRARSGPPPPPSMHRPDQRGEEPRSSGFLSIDLAERFRKQTLDRHSQHSATREIAIPHPTKSKLQQGLQAQISTPAPQQKGSSGALAVSDLLSYDSPPHQPTRSYKKVKQQNGNLSGLELLANAASPLAQHA